MKKDTSLNRSNCNTDLMPILDDELEMAPGKIHTQYFTRRTEKRDSSARHDADRGHNSAESDLTPILDDTLSYD